MTLEELKKLLEMCKQNHVTHIEYQDVKISFVPIFDEKQKAVDLPQSMKMPTDDQLLGLEPMGY